MRWPPFVLALLAAAALAACGGRNEPLPGRQQAAPTSCWPGVRVAGRAYVWVAVPRGARPPRPGDPLAAEPFCADGRAGVLRFTGRAVRRYQGIAASVALRDGRSAPYDVFVASDTLIVLGGHPLHRWFFGSDRQPVRRHGRCRRAPAVVGRVAAHPGADVRFLPVEVGGGRRRVFTLDAGTRLIGPEVDGVPRLPSRARVRVSPLRCGRWSPVAATIVVQ